MLRNTSCKYLLATLLLCLLTLPGYAFKVKKSGAIDLLAKDKRYFYQHEVGIYAIPCYSWLTYKDTQGQQSSGAFNVGAGLDYRFFFHQNVGVSLGIQYMPYTGYYNYDAFEQTSSGIDNSDPLYPNNPYIYVERYNVDEIAKLHYLEAPIKLLFITPSWNKVQLRTAIGINIGYNIATQQSLTGFYDAEMIYTDHNITLNQSESLQLGRYTDITIQSPQTVLGVQIAALAEIGIGIKLSERWQMNIDLYGSYSLNNTHNTYNSFIAMNKAYQGIVTTNLVGDIHPLALGARIGFSVYLGNPKEEILPPWKKRKLKGFNESLDGYTNQSLLNETSQDTLATQAITLPEPVTIPVTTEPEVIEPEIIEPTVAKPEVITAPKVVTPIELAVATPVTPQPTITKPVKTEPQAIKPIVTEPIVVEPKESKAYKPRALNAPILFHLNSLELTKASSSLFKHIVSTLQDNPPQKIIVIGYTCNMGDESDNLHLGKYRAEKVKYLLEQNGLQYISIETETRGENNPHLPNTTENNRKQNRCVDMIYIY
ncbi:MAG: OmpA family protein [Paludibacteraceae bacterium]|nr:OmpA family protein [Paludibacteraceae bacterium]